MISRGILIFKNSDDCGIAIPVANLPVLPEGTSISIYFPNDLCIKGARLGNYHADSKAGISCNLSFGSDHDSQDLKDETWAELVKRCHEDPVRYCDFLYPYTIDFGNNYYAGFLP